ncbi:MAG: PD-(D/E)XK nuclease family protein, partial [Anaerolineae bacterium]|nr:PD-(D/E)XK nuclease family protein [Anaerolineae bacterium]
HEQVGRVPVADVLKAFLDQTGYQAALLHAGQARGARNVAKLLSDAHASEIVGMGAFLEYIAQLRDVGTREGEASTVAAGAVQIMSVHAAKGLEFPIVAIGDAGRRAPPPRGLLIDPALGVIPPYAEQQIEARAGGAPRVHAAQSGMYRLAQRAAQDQEDAESDRLLYVAATRAQEMLLVSGVVSKSPDGWLKRFGEGLGLGEQIAGVDPEGAAVQTIALRAGAQPVRCTLYPANADLTGLAPGADRAGARHPEAEGAPALGPGELPMLRTFLPEPVVADEARREEARDPPRRVWRVAPSGASPAAPSWVVGQIVHGALAQWLYPGAAERDFDAWAAAEARGCGITDAAELRNAVRRAARILTRFQATPLYRRMDRAPARYHEVPYSGIDADGRLECGAIDALFRDAAGWTLVEFKTDRIAGRAQLEDKLAEADYQPQVARYLAAAARMLGERPRPVLCLLNVAGAVQTVEDRW